jgi:hypothetical protein
MNDKEYTLAEAAKRLAILKGKSQPYTRQYIHKLCKEGILRYRKAGQDGSLFLTTETALLEVASMKRKVGRPNKN